MLSSHPADVFVHNWVKPIGESCFAASTCNTQIQIGLTGLPSCIGWADLIYESEILGLESVNTSTRAGRNPYMSTFCTSEDGPQRALACTISFVEFGETKRPNRVC